MRDALHFRLQRESWHLGHVDSIHCVVPISTPSFTTLQGSAGSADHRADEEVSTGTKRRKFRRPVLTAISQRLVGFQTPLSLERCEQKAPTLITSPTSKAKDENRHDDAVKVLHMYLIHFLVRIGESTRKVVVSGSTSLR